MRKVKMVLASGNRGKYEEMKAALAAIDAELVFGGDFPDAPDPEETGATYEENALIKARAWRDYTGLPAISDDSGLEVSALGGAPGVKSARIVPGSDADRITWLLENLKNKNDRSARFVASLVAVFPEIEEPVICTEACPGSIATEPVGSSGFGYDPVFIPDGFDETFAELGPEIKLKISHRALALKGIAEKLKPVIQSLTVRGFE